MPAASPYFPHALRRLHQAWAREATAPLCLLSSASRCNVRDTPPVRNDFTYSIHMP